MSPSPGLNRTSFFPRIATRATVIVASLLSMPEQRRPIALPCSGFLALALTVALGNPHLFPAPSTPPTHTAALSAPTEDRDTAARRRNRRGLDRPRAQGRCPRPPKRPLGLAPHPRCRFD